MTNFEYYKNEILAIAKNGSVMALVNGVPNKCEKSDCEACSFLRHDGFCTCNMILWLYSEHIEQPRLTKKERLFCELVETGWIARDADGALCWTAEKPQKDEREKEWRTEGGAFSYIKKEMFCDIFPFIKWTDTEPWAVKDLLKLEV